MAICRTNYDQPGAQSLERLSAGVSAQVAGATPVRAGDGSPLGTAFARP
jgi:hypothetical protein